MKKYDIVIVGGGIAGVATGEIFARSGFKTLVIEKHEKLCMETSGLHHEWFHFGSLYSIFPNNQFFRTMVGGIEDILDYYRDFAGMNLRIDG
ncbi:MAG: FAD-dependent oxidoreductase, partial [bacterium]